MFVHTLGVPFTQMMKQSMTVLGILLTGQSVIGQAPAPYVLADPDPDVGLHFGHQVAASGDYAFVSENPSPEGMGSSRVHVFYRWAGGMNTWDCVQSISAPDGDGIGFGYGIHAWEDRLAIYRVPHSYTYLGAAVCRARTVFMYRLDDSGQWLQDGVIGGEFLSSGQCSAGFDGVRLNILDAEGDVFAFSSPNSGWPSPYEWLIEVYRRVGDALWIPEYILPAAAYPDVAVNGDSLIYYADSQTIGLYSLTPDELNLLHIGGVSSGSPFKTLVACDGILAIGQPSGQIGDYTSGRVVVRKLDEVDYPVIDTLRHDSTGAFGFDLRAAGNTIVVHEGGVLSMPIRFFIYERTSQVGDDFGLTHVLSVIDSFPGGVHPPKFDLASEGILIASVMQPPGSSSYDTYVVTLWDLVDALGVDGEDGSTIPITYQRAGDYLHVCLDLEAPGTDAKVFIYSSAGRVISSMHISKACTGGIELVRLNRGLYFVEVRSGISRSSFKFQW